MVQTLPGLLVLKLSGEMQGNLGKCNMDCW